MFIDPAPDFGCIERIGKLKLDRLESRRGSSAEAVKKGNLSEQHGQVGSKTGHGRLGVSAKE
jgi:hypothetical protein